jgi:hypothetical protein
MSVPDSLEELFASALALEARARPRDMADLWSRFESVLAIRKGPAEDASPNTRPRPAEGSETRHLSPSVMPAQVRDFLATGAPSPGAAGVPVDDDRTVMAAPPEAPDSSPTIALERPEPHPAHASHAAHAPYAQAAAPGPRAPYVAPPSHGGESSVIVLEPDPSEIVDRTLTLADRDKAAVAPAQRIVHAPPPPPPARAQVQQPPPAPPPHWVPPPPAPAMAPPMAPIAPMASPMGQGPTNTMQSRPGPPMQHAPPIMVQQYVPPPPPSAQPQQASATSTRTLLWVVVILLVVAVLGVGAVTLLVLAKR